MTQRAVDVRIPLDWIVAEVAAQIAAQVPVDRRKAMVERLGEACKVDAAAHELDCSTRTVYRLLESGKILAACEGSRVDVRSLADYIERRPHRNEQEFDIREMIR